MVTKPRIVISVETLLAGGAESFAIRLANSVSSKFEVYLIIIQGNLVDRSVANKLKDDIHLVEVTFPFEWLIRKFDSGLLRLDIDFSLRGILCDFYVRRFLIAKQIKIIHTNQFKVDYVFNRANEELRIPHIITVHGDYLNFSERSKHKGLRIRHFREKARNVIQSVNKIVYISDHQYEFLISELALPAISNKALKIYNGVLLENGDHASATPSGFRRKDFVFGMVARGIKEKGWEEAIQAFLKIHAPRLQLILVGGSTYLDELRRAYSHPDIHFAGYSENPTEWIRLFDVGLLPSTFASESLPTSVIEYMMMGKPVIASDKGEIKKMLKRDNESCGIVLSVNDNQIAEHELAAAMELLWRDKELYQKMADNTKKLAEYYDMKNCADAYIGVYHSLMQNQS